MHPVKDRLPKPDNNENIGFGKHYTDHMLTIDYDKAKGGWQKPQIIPYGDLEIPTTATSLHYGISVYDSLTVTTSAKNGKAQAFRPDLYLKSFLNSTTHLDMPDFDVSEL